MPRTPSSNPPRGPASEVHDDRGLGQERDPERLAEYLRATFDAIDEAVSIFDGDMRLVAWNKVFEDLDFFPREHIRSGAPLVDLYRDMARRGNFGEGDSDAIVEEHMRRAIEGPLIEVEELVDKGRTVRIRRFRLPDGGVCATLREITDEIELQEQLRQSDRMDAVGRLSGGIAHDFNNVLASIIGSLELARLEPEEAGRYLDIAMESAERGADLTHRLLAFARKRPLSPTRLDPTPLLTNLATMLRSLLGEDIHLEFECPDDLWSIEVDPNEFEHVVVNIAVNARDAMPLGGRLCIRGQNVTLADAGPCAALSCGDYLLLTFEDSGVGMEEDVQEKIFEPFFTTKPTGEGTGLGLAMAHGFVKQSNGHIEVRSQPDVGTTLSIHLPRADPAEPVTDCHCEPTVGGDRPQQSVLVVEDDSLLRLIIQEMLTANDFQVTAVENGEAALKALGDEGPFELLLTDVVLPGELHGARLARAAKERQADLRVLYMSGHSYDLMVKNGRLEAGVQLMEKPFTQEELLDSIRRATA